MEDQPGTIAVDGRPLLREVQRLATSGARAVEVFEADGLMLAVPQLALDVPGTPAHMNGGSSDTDLLLWRWSRRRLRARRHACLAPAARMRSTSRSTERTISPAPAPGAAPGPTTATSTR